VPCQRFPWLLPVHQSSLLLRLPDRPPTLLGTCYHLQQTQMVAQYEKYQHAIRRAAEPSNAVCVAAELSHQSLQLLRLPKYVPILFADATTCNKTAMVAGGYEGINMLFVDDLGSKILGFSLN